MMLNCDYFMPNKNFRGFTVATIDHAISFVKAAADSCFILKMQ